MIKMKKFLVWCLIAVVQASAMIVPISAYAQTSTAYSGLAALNQIIQGAYTAAATSAAGSTAVSAAAAEYATLANGMRIPIATTGAAAVGASRLAGLAAVALKAGTGVGLASILLPILYEKSGYKVCPPPDFFCKPGPDSAVKPTTGGWFITGFWDTSKVGNGGTPAAACSDLFSKATASIQTSYGSFVAYQSGTTWGCKGSANGSHVGWQTSQTATCPAGSTQSGASCTTKGPDVPVVEGEITSSLESSMNASAAKQKTVYDAVRATGNPNVIQGNDPVTVTAPSVSTPPIKTTEQVSNSDGTTSTKVVTTVTTVTPVITGTTINNTNITYPSTTTSTTVITNNTTNVQTTSDQTKTETAASPEKAPPPAPKATDPVTDFCVANPTLNVCKNATVSGTCKEITCTGDAIFCAVAQQVAESNCMAVKQIEEIKARSEYVLGNTVLAGGPDPLAGVPTRANGTTVNATSIDQSGWLGGGACFPDKSFSIQGKTVTIPFKTVCEYMIVFRMAVMMVGLIGAARILAGAVIRE